MDLMKQVANDKYDPPHTINPGDSFVYGDKDVKEWEDENKAYDTGWRHTHDQKK